MMADDQFVPLNVFVTTTKTLLTLIHDLGVEMQTQRVALMRAQTLPIPAEYLMLVGEDVRKAAQIRMAREAIQSLTTTEEIDDILRKLEGLS